MRDFSEKILLDYFKTFLLLLTDKINDTYLASFNGEDLLSPQDKRKHFIWCYEVTSNYFQHNAFPVLNKAYFLPKLIDYFDKRFYFGDRSYITLQKNIRNYHFGLKNDDLNFIFNNFLESL